MLFGTCGDLRRNGREASLVAERGKQIPGESLEQFQIPRLHLRAPVSQPLRGRKPGILGGAAWFWSNLSFIVRQHFEGKWQRQERSEEHTSELQSQSNL